MSLEPEGSLEAQLALETVVQVGPVGCAHPVQGRGSVGPAAGLGEEWAHFGGRGVGEVWWWCTGPPTYSCRPDRGWTGPPGSCAGPLSSQCPAGGGKGPLDILLWSPLLAQWGPHSSRARAVLVPPTLCDAPMGFASGFSLLLWPLRGPPAQGRGMNKNVLPWGCSLF